jgi:TolB-like protein/tetratricopeptide (TPR) repeat protein
MLPNNQRVEFYEFGPFRLDLVSHQMFERDRPVPLSPKTFDILKLLVQNRGRVLTKGELIKQVWLDQFVEENNLAVRVSLLRKALAEGPDNRFIETVSGSGYRFVGRVREVFSKGVDAREEVFDSLAVMPLINEHNRPGLNYLCDGITESLISSLSHIANLRVMARSTVFRYKTPGVDPQRAGQELGVRAVLAGKVSQVSSSLIFDIEMIDVRDGAYLWGAKYKRHSSELFTLQEDLAREISENLRVKLSNFEESRIAKRHTENPEAYQLYMQGRYFWNKRTEKGIRKGIDYFEEAIKLDANYAPAYAGLAACFISLTVWNILPAEESFPAARGAAAKALELDNTLAEAYGALGIIDFYTWNWQDSGKEFEQALAFNPNSAQVYFWYSTYWMAMGRTDEALAAARRSQTLDPLSPLICIQIARILLLRREYDAALEWCYQALDLDENFPWAPGIMGLIHAERGSYEEAISEFKKCIALTHDTETEGLLGYVYAISGRGDEALRLLAELQQRAEEKYVPSFASLFIYIGLKDKEKAFELLERLFEERSHILAGLKVLHVFDFLRADPRFSSILRRVGLPE